MGEYVLKIIYEIIEIIASFIEIFIAYQVFYNILGKQKIKNQTLLLQEILLSFLGMFLIRLSNSVNIFSLFTVLVSAFYLCITGSILYKANFVKVLSITGLYILFMSYFDFFVMSAVAYLLRKNASWDQILFSIGWPRICMIIIIKICWILLYMKSQKYLKKYSITPKEAYIFIPISAIGICTSFPMATYTFQSSQKIFIIVWLLMVTMLLLAFSTIYFILSYKEEHTKTTTAMLNSMLTEEKYKEIQLLYTNNSKLYHDLNNHLNVLYQLLNVSDIKAAKDYLQEVSEPIQQLTQKNWTENTIINVILNAKADTMKSKRIVFDYNIDIPSHIPVQDSDLCTILANLLDNAIEAAEKSSSQRRIQVLIKKINDFLLIKISNTCVNTPAATSLNSKLPETDKPDKQLHGWGLKNVETAVKKYNGTINFSHSEPNTVSVKIILFFQNNL